MEQRDRAVAAGITRRTFLKRTAAAGAAVAGGTLWRAASASPGIGRAPSTQIDHLIISCQENRSFDHYFGYAPEVQAEGFGPPPGYFQPDSGGGEHPPFEFTSPTTADPPHSWDAVHLQYDNGAMDGFWQTSQAWIGDGDAAIGYYTERELPFYYSLLDDSALCANYFCSVLGPTWPNRFYFAAGTSGGITTNGVWGYGVFDYPIILDLVDEAGISWGVYNMNWDSVPFGNTDNVFVFWKRFAHDQRTRGSRGSFLNDARKGRLPQVSWLVSSFAHGKDEHPPADVTVGMGLQEECITAVRESPLWESSAFLLTYDEHGGYFDHVAPPQIDAYGLGVRVPLWVVSPFAKKGPVASSLPADHSSTLKLIEAVFGLPTLASRNDLFDVSTPTGATFRRTAHPLRPGTAGTT
jgi:phospholipase C